MGTIRLQQQREEAEARRQARAAEKAAKKAGLREQLLPPVKASAMEDPARRGTPADGQPARFGIPAPAVANWKPFIAKGGWRARMKAKQTERQQQELPLHPTLSVTACAVAQAPGTSEEESKKDDDAVPIPARSSKEAWRPRRGR